MSVKDRKFDDLDLHFDKRVKIGRKDRMAPKYAVVYSMTGLPRGSSCLLCSDTGNERERWLRKTRNEGMNGSTRYVVYSNFNEALDASIKWARRKDEEYADGQR